MMAGRKLVTLRKPSSPSDASSVWNPQAWTSSANPVRVAWSSSTMSTRSPGSSVAVVVSSSIVIALSMLRGRVYHPWVRFTLSVFRRGVSPAQTVAFRRPVRPRKVGSRCSMDSRTQPTDASLQPPRITMAERLSAFAEVVLCSGFPTQIVILVAMSGLGMRLETSGGGWSPALRRDALPARHGPGHRRSCCLFLRAHGESARDVLLGTRAGVAGSPRRSRASAGRVHDRARGCSPS